MSESVFKICVAKSRIYLKTDGREGENDYSAEEGTEISIPSMYAKKMIILVDAKTQLPVSQKVYDEKGLFESYEFSKNNKNYNF